MAVDDMAQAVRRQLGLGRLVPLGVPADGLWLAERAAVQVLREAVAPLPGLRLGTVRLSLAHPELVAEPVVPPPPSALPPGPLRIDASCAATLDQPVPTAADRLRRALAAAADQRLGLDLSHIDLRVTELLDQDLAPAPENAAFPGTGRGQDNPADGVSPDGHRTTGDWSGDARAGTGLRGSQEHPAQVAERAAAAAATAVDGVVRLDPVWGAMDRAVQVLDLTGQDDGGAVASHHVRVQLAVSADRRTVDTARAVRDQVAVAVGATAAVAVTVAVLVTAIEQR